MKPTIDDEIARKRIGDWIAAGTPATEIERRLRDSGLAPEKAASLIDEALSGIIAADSRVRRTAERGELLWGILWCLCGLAFLAGGLVSFHLFGRLPVGPVGVFLVSAAALGRGGFLILRAMT